MDDIYMDSPFEDTMIDDAADEIEDAYDDIVLDDVNDIDAIADITEDDVDQVSLEDDEDYQICMADAEWNDMTDTKVPAGISADVIMHTDAEDHEDNSYMEEY